MIEEISIGTWEDFTEPDEAVLCLDSCLYRPNLQLLADYRIDKKGPYLALILPYVAKAFGVNRTKLLEKWVEVYGRWEILK